ncbi:MAG: T9SS C-terminal target domain-containing protein [Ignavibacteriales bacterium]|nr:MAG: T9SS C-terminal target domain-containing protein [Ignavibacteriales bacterium]
MRKHFFYTATLILFGISISSGQEVIQKGKSLYISNTLVVKFKKDFSVSPQTLNKLTPKFSVQNFTQLFPPQSKLNKGEESLSRIYLLKYSSPENPLELAAKISKQNNVEWAEPKYIQTISYSPNDSLYSLGRQQNLKRVLADSAWNVTKGDSSVIIGIVDTGVDWTHPDLLANVWYDNGRFVGYDLGGSNGTPDNDPSEDISSQNRYHGTHVAGIACAVTNNQKGIASIGFNCSFIPVKVSRGDTRDANGYPYIYYGYEGIKYAADNKARVINCSWGGFDYSNLGLEVINYAISKGALVVAAAGNDGELTDFYPASFNGVLSVGWLETDSDLISSAANYGRTIDVFAPGTSILSTWHNNSYNSISGSSMSSPLVAGLAGLVFSTHPNYTVLQAGEQIRVTADNIEQSNNSNLKYLLGSGRINAFRAVNETNTTSLRAANVKFIDEGNGNGVLESGETVSIEITFKNFLKAVTNVNVQLININNDNSVVLLNDNFIIGQVGALDSVKNLSNKFRFRVQPNASLNHNLNLLLKFTGTGYSDFQWISARINPTYDTHNVGNITMSITSKGALGFNDFPNNLEGSGFKYNGGDNLLFEGAFMYGTSANKVMDVARVTTQQDTDFVTVTPVRMILNDGATQHSVSVFNDNRAANKLGIETKFHAYTYVNAPNDNFILLITEMKNTTSQNISNLYAGYFFDWDIPADNPTIDSTAYDLTDNFGYAFCTNKTLASTIVGAALVSSNKYGYYPIDNNATSGSVILTDVNGFSDAEKWITLFSGIVNNKIGPTDISFVISGGDFSIPAQSTLKVGFAIAAGATLNELRNAIKQSRNKYQDTVDYKNIPTEIRLYQNYPNPFNSNTVISYSLPNAGQVTLKVYDLLGREVSILVDDYKQPGVYNSQFSIRNFQLPSGVYFYQLNVGGNIQTKKMILLK